MSKLVDKQAMFALMVADLIMFCGNNGYQVTFGEAWRTKEQAEIYAASGKGILDSKHCIRLAVDLNIFKNGALLVGHESLEKIGAFWESIGGIWGGRFKRIDDYCHFEMK